MINKIFRRKQLQNLKRKNFWESKAKMWIKYIIKILSLRKEVPKAHTGMRRFRYCPLGGEDGLGVTQCFRSTFGT